MRISSYAEAPYQGVSQAPAQVRLPTQAEALSDIFTSVPSGAQKRPPMNWACGLEDLATNDIASTYIPKGSVGNFLFTVTNESGVVTPRLYSLGGLPSSAAMIAAETVTISSDAQAYLNSGNPSAADDIVLLTVEDYTFILNRKVVVANGATASSTRPFEGMLWVRQAAYARTYQVIVRQGATVLETVTLVTPNGKDATDGKDVDTDIIAGGLYGSSYPVGSTSATNGASVTGSLSSLTGSGFTVTLQGGVIYLSHATVDFTLEVKDGQGGQALLAIKDKVQTFADLPKKAPVAGFTVKITQQTGTDDDDFWVQWVETAGRGTGLWQEALAPGANLGVDPLTLPVGLVYDSGAGTWGIDVLDWVGRTTGNEELVPDPGFVGQVLEDITFWRGRLALIYNEGCRASSATDPLRLYPSTLASVLDDDAFEVINPLEGQAEFVHGVAFKQVLVLWGRKGQAKVRATQGALTPDTVACEPYSHYEVSPLVRPQASNDRIYFATPRGSAATAVYEVEVPSTGNEDAAEGDDMSVSVPRYIPAGINHAATCVVNYLTVYGKLGDTYVTPHLYRYSDRQRVQNAWSRWHLPEGCTYAGGFFVNTVFYVIVKRGGVVHLLTMDTADGVVDPGSDYLAHLNYKLTDDTLISLTYDSVTDVTTAVFPYVPAVAPTFLVAYPGGVAGPTVGGELLDAPEGTVAEGVVWTAASNTVTIPGDWSQVNLIIGEDYTGAWTFSRLFYRDPEGRPNRTGRMVLKKLTLDLDRTVTLAARITIGGRPPVTYNFESTLLDTPAAAYDRVNLYSGPWSIPLGGTSEEVTIEVLMDGWGPANVLGYTWEGEVNPKAMRMQGG